MTHDPSSRRAIPRIVHVHIPKTAGTALLRSLKLAYGTGLRVYPVQYESEFGRLPYADYDYFGGHIGFKVARDIEGDRITVLREPVDRFLSNYFFLRQQYETGEARNHKTFLAAKHGLDEFVRVTDEPILVKEFANRMTWQIAHSHRLELRQELIDAGVSDEDLVALALTNLRSCAIVGVQTDMDAVAAAVHRRYGVPLVVGHHNVTRSRMARSDVSARTISRIEQWVPLDIELYRQWTSVPSLEPLGTDSL